jgi:hypothetical protein
MGVVEMPIAPAELQRLRHGLPSYKSRPSAAFSKKAVVADRILPDWQTSLRD